MPSVMTTHSGTPASTASMTAALANRGGTNTTDTLAPVASAASFTLSKTGMPSRLWPPLPGVTPATTLLPEATIRRVCLLPSDPVMPWTRIRLCPLRKIDIVLPRPSTRPAIELPCGGRELGRAPRGAVHGVHELHDVVLRLVEDPPAFLGVVTVQPDHQRHRDGLAARLEHLDRRDDAVGDLVARGDAAEHVDEHAAHRRIGQDDLQPVGHHLRGRAAADVEEVRRLHPTELLTCVRHHVQRGHDQARAVA